MQKIASFIAAGVLTVLMGGIASAQQFITFGGGPTGGTYFAISSGMAKIFNERLENIEARVRATSGAFENPVLIETKEIDLGPTNANLAVWAREGTEVYDGRKMDNVSLFMAGLAGGLLHVVVLADSDIKSLADLKGNRWPSDPRAIPRP